MKNSRIGKLAALAAALGAAWTLAGSAAAQDFDDEFADGEFVDGEFIEGYTFVADFMPPDELKRLMDEGSDEIVIVDTAAPLIWEDERIPGAINYPWVHELELPVTLPRDKTLVLYCACNDHEDSVDMAKKLSQVGYLYVKVLEGGWFEWQDLGYATEGLAVDGQ